MCTLRWTILLGQGWRFNIYRIKAKCDYLSVKQGTRRHQKISYTRRDIRPTILKVMMTQNIMTKVVLLSSLHSLLVSASTLVVPTLTTEDENNATNDSCLDDPYSLPLGVIILDTRDYSTLNATKPVTVGSKHHFGNSCAEANIRRQPSWSRVRKATRDKRSDCAKGNYKNKRMCDYNPRRIPAAIDMVDCGKCGTAVGSLPQTTCRINGLRGTWRPKTIDILLPFLTSTGVYKLKKQEIAVGCHCHITSRK